MCLALTNGIAELQIEVKGMLQVGMGGRVRPDLGAGIAETSTGECLRRPVIQAPGRGQRDPLDRRPIVPVPPAGEVVLQCQGELPGVRIKPGLGRLPDGGEQHRVVSGEPGKHLLQIVEMLRRDIGLGCRQADRVTVRP